MGRAGALELVRSSNGPQRPTVYNGSMSDLRHEMEQVVGRGPFSPVSDPYPLYARLREEAPVCDVTGMYGTGRTWFVTRYEDVRTVLRDPEAFSSRVNSRGVGRVLGRTIIEMDGPEHLKHRNLVTPALAPRALRGDFPKLVREIAHEIVDRFAAQGQCDLVPDFTFIFPLRVFVEILGLPVDQVEPIHHLTVDLSLSGQDPERAIRASEKLAEGLLPLVAERRTNPSDDLMSVLAASEIDGERMTDQEVVNFLRLLVSAGADTTYHLLGSMIALALRDPALLERISSDRERIDDYILETLRYESPIATIPREVMADTQLGGVHLSAGDDVLVHLGSANRDGAHYAEPDRFDLDRDSSDHLGFGIGRHFCAGSRLALLEARVGFDVLLERLDDLRLAAGQSAEIVGFAFRGPTKLPVTFRAS